MGGSGTAIEGNHCVVCSPASSISIYAKTKSPYHVGGSGCIEQAIECACSACVLCVSCPLAIAWCCVKLPCQFGWHAVQYVMRTASCCGQKSRILPEYSSFSDMEPDTEKRK